MKTKLLATVLAWVAGSFTLLAQDYAFRVIANKGAVEYKSGDAWQPVKTGASLKDSDEVKLGENAYLGLVHKSGKPMELREAKSYKVIDLAKNVGTGSSVLNKYTDFILSANSAEAKKNRLAATGAVTRATFTPDIKVFLPENQYAGIFNKIVVINWESAKTKGPFVVTVMSMYEDELMKEETPENHFRLDLSNPKIEKESKQALLVIVSSKSDPNIKSGRYLVKNLSDDESAKIKTAWAEISGDVKDETALNKFLQAGFYEEHKLFIDAIAAYEDAIRMAPDVDLYKDAYEEFLLRNKLKVQK
ncbi:MAG TPA: hypothetical protein DCE81_09080 [Cytophagales bacterium]|nr:hypothetical protein [Cytophagales bacterium]